jgi:myo-inositol-1(or 4)-monophosphatase
MSPADLETLAAELATGAGRLLRDDYFGKVGLSFDSKADADGVDYGDVVSEADAAAHRHIATALALARPADVLLSEEGEPGAAQRATVPGTFTWIADPLDGTVNFVLGNPHWCVSVACANADGEVVAAAVYDACRDELFVARRGGGARLNGRTLAVRPIASLRLATIVTSMMPGDRNAAFQRDVAVPLARATAGARSMWAPALDLCWLAAGRVHAFAEWSLKEWDTAAAGFILEQAGGACQPWVAHAGLLAAATPALLDELAAVVNASAT